MFYLVGKIWLFVITLMSVLVLKNNLTLASSSCSLCILEVGVTSELGEEYDFIIIGNSTSSSISLSSVQIQYFNSLGVFDSKLNLSGTLYGGQTKVFVSEKLKTYNPTASNLSLSLYSGGGSLKLIKVLTSSTTEYDTVGWGLTTISEDAPVLTDDKGIFYRIKNTNNEIIDTGYNADDFESYKDDCSGININEIQPFATDIYGKAIESWVELLILEKNSSECSIATSDGKYFTFDTDSLGEVGDIVAINSVSRDGIQQLLELPNPTGSVSIALKSNYQSSQSVYIPIAEVEFKDLEKTQSYGIINEFGSNVWKKTFQPTPNEENILLESPLITPTGNPDACMGVYINEILPNPLGSDTGSEWLEIINTTNNVLGLDQCVIEIDSEKYFFPSGSVLGPGLILRYFNLYNEDGGEKSIYLRNSDESYIALYRIYVEEITLLQSFTYADAPENLSYSRFDTGWAWTYALTPSEVNIYQSTKPIPLATESKATFASNTPGTISSVVNKSSTTTKKSSTSNKNLASTAKTTTGAKNTNERDVYVEPGGTPIANSNYVFVVLGALAILYAIYEYKIDIQNIYYKWRRNKTISQEDRQTS